MWLAQSRSQAAYVVGYAVKPANWIGLEQWHPNCDTTASTCLDAMKLGGDTPPRSSNFPSWTLRWRRYGLYFSFSPVISSYEMEKI